MVVNFNEYYTDIILEHFNHYIDIVDFVHDFIVVVNVNLFDQW